MLLWALLVCAAGFLSSAQAEDFPSTIGTTTTMDGKTFAFSKVAQSWSEAKATCEMYHFQLFSAETQADQESMVKAWKQLRLPRDIYWLCGQRPQSTKKWVWCNEKSIPLDKQEGFENWGLLQPISTSPVDYCLATSYFILAEGKWRSKECNKPHFFICVPSTTSGTPSDVTPSTSDNTKTSSPLGVPAPKSPKT